MPNNARFSIVLTTLVALTLCGAVPSLAAGGGGGESKKAVAPATLPAVPTPEEGVTILGKPVITAAERAAAEKAATEASLIPAVLQTPESQRILAERFPFSFYDHAPIKGDPTAPITVVLFEDLRSGMRRMRSWELRLAAEWSSPRIMART
jgi:hypothetical protein